MQLWAGLQFPLYKILLGNGAKYLMQRIQLCPSVWLFLEWSRSRSQHGKHNLCGKRPFTEKWDMFFNFIFSTIKKLWPHINTNGFCPPGHSVWGRRAAWAETHWWAMSHMGSPAVSWKGCLCCSWHGIAETLNAWWSLATGSCTELWDGALQIKKSITIPCFSSCSADMHTVTFWFWFLFYPQIRSYIIQHSMQARNSTRSNTCFSKWDPDLIGLSGDRSRPFKTWFFLEPKQMGDAQPTEVAAGKCSWFI